MLPGAAIPSNGAPDIRLQPFDRVTILRKPGFELLRTVKITGEVRFPGRYAPTHKDDRPSSLIARSWGTLADWYADGGRFFRNLNNAGTVNGGYHPRTRCPRRSKRHHLQLGDSLDIPEYIPTVHVDGAVQYPHERTC